MYIKSTSKIQNIENGHVTSLGVVGKIGKCPMYESSVSKVFAPLDNILFIYSQLYTHVHIPYGCHECCAGLLTPKASTELFTRLHLSDEFQFHNRSLSCF